jgi:hypothetical protein
MAWVQAHSDFHLGEKISAKASQQVKPSGVALAVVRAGFREAALTLLAVPSERVANASCSWQHSRGSKKGRYKFE